MLLLEVNSILLTFHLNVLQKLYRHYSSVFVKLLYINWCM